MVLSTLSGDAVSRYSFGTMQFGEGADESASATMYAACREAGINFFDTANVYTGGKSETILGRLVAKEREDIFIATKTGSHKRLLPEVVDEEVPQSLRRLSLDQVDLLYIHQWDPVTPLQLQIEAVGKYIHSGQARMLGLSNFAAWKVMKARHIAYEMEIDIRVLQPMYNLVKRQVEVEVLPMAISEELIVCPYSPLGGGLLTGKYSRGETGRLQENKMYASRYAPRWMYETAEALVALAAETGVHPATLAVAWTARHAGVWGPIISAKSLEQLKPSLQAIDFDMDDSLYARIAALSSAPAPDNDRLEEASL